MRAFPVLAAALGSGIVAATFTLAVVLAPASDRAPVDGRLVANEQAIETTTTTAETTTGNPMPDLGYTTTAVPSSTTVRSTPSPAGDPTTPVTTTVPNTDVAATTAVPPPPTTTPRVHSSATWGNCVADPHVGFVCSRG
jgi:hypothetical protein